VTAGDVTVRRRLEELVERTQLRLAALSRDHAGIVAASEGSNADDEHDPEGATIGFERAQVAALVTAAEQQLTEAAAALQRLDEGRYGVCERCGDPIAEDRLSARPTARTCIRCASR
jgi:RNA polymerase-binding transcription factor DksA